MSHLQYAFRSINDTFARAQSRYDRQLPREEPEAVAVDPMDQLRDDMGKKLESQDIHCELFDYLNDSGEGMEMIRKAVFGDKAAAIAIFDAAIKKVALDRAA